MPTYGHNPHIIADDANYGFWQGSRTLVEDKVHVCRMQTGQPIYDLPESLREDIIREHHDTPMSGHFTWKRTLDLISRSGGLVYGTRYRLMIRSVTLANGARQSTIDHLDYCPPSTYLTVDGIRLRWTSLRICLRHQTEMMRSW